METTKQIERYPKSNVYPISQTTINTIAANMEQEGFDPGFPILLKDGAIVDGYHRYKAALKAGVEPIFREFEGSEDDALRYVLRANGDRRHLNEGQKAAAAILINRRLGENAKSSEQMATDYGVKPTSMNRLRSYSDDELETIVSGAKTQEHIKESKKKKTNERHTTYTLTKSQSAKVASLSVSLDERSKKIISRAFDLGLKALEEEIKD